MLNLLGYKGVNYMKIKIKDYEFNIIEVDKTDKDFVKNDELMLYGQTIYENQTIKIYKDLPLIRKRQTLIHELTHAFMDVYLASYHIKDKFDEEDICCFMGTYSEDILKIVNNYFLSKEVEDVHITKEYKNN